MKTILTLISRYWPTALVVAVIVYATLTPQPVEPDTLPMIPGLDKLIHAVMMGGLVGAVAFDWHRVDPRRRPLTSRVMMWICFGATLFSAADETLQGLLPIDRPSDINDFWADLAGVCVAYLTAPAAVTALFRKKH